MALNPTGPGVGMRSERISPRTMPGSIPSTVRSTGSLSTLAPPVARTRIG
jgi:hypothetical protein